MLGNVKIYQQIDSQSFHMGTSANEEWFINKMGALDVEAPIYNTTTQKTKQNETTESWVIKTKEEWKELSKIVLEMV